jgi:hypothetical protein
VGHWRDHEGCAGEILLRERDVAAIRKSTSDIRSVRDQIRNDVVPRIVDAIGASKLPPWLAEAKAALHLWRSQERIHRLHHQWSTEAPNAAPEALAILTEWVHRDRHLWQYADGMRGQSLRRRREQYRIQAATWARRYRTVILDDRNLSREARWGEESDVRFLAGPSDLRSALRLAFGTDVIEHKWISLAQRSETDERSWCEQAIDAWKAGSARKVEIVKSNEKKEGNAWARRKKKKMERAVEKATARRSVDNTAE